MKRALAALATLSLLAACGESAPEELDEATLENRAEALERSADETTNELVGQIQEDARTDTPVAADEGEGDEPPVKGEE
jgi:predicted small lipoprotein YifL